MGTSLTTKKRIVACTEELLKACPLSRISVTEVCRRAGVSRTTFYTYFTDVYAIYEWIWRYYIARFLSGSKLVRTIWRSIPNF
ncbi:TetR/AcrR family transcriptional regulator [Limosilactobacillus kribbianus]|uniref:TetR/AcrR family transcriptional regulator n=1 Tax=Limosilactobacillus kribbianus TaxID=2982695 RepID=UPI0034CDB00D